jgi:hypothetical protein
MAAHGNRPRKSGSCKQKLTALDAPPVRERTSFRRAHAVVVDAYRAPAAASCRGGLLTKSKPLSVRWTCENRSA